MAGKKRRKVTLAERTYGGEGLRLIYVAFSIGELTDADSCYAVDEADAIAYILARSPGATVDFTEDHTEREY